MNQGAKCLEKEKKTALEKPKPHLLNSKYISQLNQGGNLPDSK